MKSEANALVRSSPLNAKRVIALSLAIVGDAVTSAA